MSETVFGSGSAHPVTGMPLENGRGALPHDQQVELHCAEIEQKHGKAAGDSMREKVRAWIVQQSAPDPVPHTEPENLPQPEVEPLAVTEVFKPSQES